MLLLSFVRYPVLLMVERLFVGYNDWSFHLCILYVPVTLRTDRYLLTIKGISFRWHLHLDLIYKIVL